MATNTLRAVSEQLRIITIKQDCVEAMCKATESKANNTRPSFNTTKKSDDKPIRKSP